MQNNLLHKNTLPFRLFFQSSKDLHISFYLDVGKGRKKLKQFLPNNIGNHNNEIMIISGYHLFRIYCGHTAVKSVTWII